MPHITITDEQYRKPKKPKAMKEIALQLTTTQYRQLLKCYFTGQAASNSRTPTRKQMREFFDIGNQLCSHAADFGMQHLVDYGSVNDVYLPSAELEREMFGEPDRMPEENRAERAHTGLAAPKIVIGRNMRRMLDENGEWDDLIRDVEKLGLDASVMRKQAGRRKGK